MTHPSSPFPETHHSPGTTAAVVTLFWIVAAAAVRTAHAELDAVSQPVADGATIAVIVGAAYGYTRLCARHAGIRHALAVGIAWLVFGIAMEIAVAARIGHGWYLILGSPDRPLLRNVFLALWIFGPALFAARKSEL